MNSFPRLEPLGSDSCFEDGTALPNVVSRNRSILAISISSLRIQ